MELKLKLGLKGDCFANSQRNVFLYPEQLNYAEGVILCRHITEGIDCDDDDCKFEDFGFLPHAWVVERATGKIHEVTIAATYPTDLYFTMLEQDKDELVEAVKEHGFGNMQVNPYERIFELEAAGYDVTELRKKYE
jgi:hypothetical protein